MAAVIRYEMSSEQNDGYFTDYGSQDSPQTLFPPFPVQLSTVEEKPLKTKIDGLNGVEARTNGSYVLPEKKTSKWCVLLLTEKELQRMPKKYRPDFRIGKTVAHVRQKENGVYEIRCQINKKQITASSKNLETAKVRFIEALKAFEKTNGQTPVPVPGIEPLQPAESAPAAPCVTLGEYMLKWLETVKKPMVKENSYKLYVDCYYKVNICPVLGDKTITGIKPFELQEFINGLVSDGKTATAKKCAMLLKAVFDYAVIDDIIPKSPMLKIVVPYYEAEKGVPLSREEEKSLVCVLVNGGDVYVQAYVFMAYTGLRKSELASVEIKDGWINLISAKGRKGCKVKTRSVPISPMLTPLLPLMDINGIRNINTDVLTMTIKKYLPNHHVHELRHTFITRCQECGIRREVVSIWAGHAADRSITTTVYTHLEHNKDMQLEEIKKFKYEL